ncbi:RDD family protein [Aureibaculum sp. 2210JD6-5]|uniref:RDD family protein n=1 Tax=Aureibaculum sp. 2210JD6-5 TaxID=3103957 RepID=UPI002AAD3001|nr:RDD family protein [Aureibaculum sp. 2210JD6-5]MDY7395049.1 RDD family protein [Aureibaculum sp. 2210JD6-5]
MDNFQIETAQNVSINQNVANVSTRIGSFLLDLLIIAGYVIIMIWILNAIGLVADMESWMIYLIMGLPIFFYSLLFEVLMNGQTPGKYANKIRVVKIDGSKPTFGSYLLRWMLRLIDIDIASGSVALLTILLNGKGQRLGDIAASTTVISEKKRVTIHDTLVADIPDDYVPTFSQVTMLSDADIQSIKELYRSAKRKGNHGVIVKLHQKIIEITDIKTELKPIDFVDVVIKDYNYYTQN